LWWTSHSLLSASPYSLGMSCSILLRIPIFIYVYVHHRIAEHKQRLRLYFSSQIDTFYFLMKTLRIMNLPSSRSCAGSC
jgi:hypothetical protein